MQFGTLQLEREGALLRVWLNRPERRNALNGQALRDIEALFTALQTEFETRLVVLGGRGLSFCAGADRKDPPGTERMSARSGASDRERRHAAQLGRRASEAIGALEAVTVARIHGHAVGGGVALALACDFRIAADDTIFHVPEVDLGIPLSWGATPRLIQEVGAARAREIILMCDRIDAPTAERWNLVNRCVPAAQLDASVDEWARRLLAKPEIAVHMTKTQFRAYAHGAVSGDVAETDGDLLAESSRLGVAKASFPSK